jgi:carnosine N-methyltransferase
MEEEEEKALLRVTNALKDYRGWALSFVQKAEHDFSQLEEAHRHLLEKHVQPKRKWLKMKTCIELNGHFIDQILTVNQLFENQGTGGREFIGDPAVVPKEVDLDKVRSTLKQFVREWSQEGQAERDVCFKPLIDEIEARFAGQGEINSVRILVPGSGLGRLPWELAKRGYASQGNEFSFFMLLSSNFILNRSGGQQYPIFPFVLQSANVVQSEDQFRQINVPDVSPGNIPAGVDFSMAGGDFLEAFSDPEAFDCVATCFFLDTAKNVVAYVEAIHKILKPGGLWVNIGPLLYHWSEMPHEISIELSWEELRRVITSYGFVIEKEERRQCTYDDNARSMLHSVYDCVFFSATKPNGNKGPIC